MVRVGAGVRLRKRRAWQRGLELDVDLGERGGCVREVVRVGEPDRRGGHAVDLGAQVGRTPATSNGSSDEQPQTGRAGRVAAVPCALASAASSGSQPTAAAEQPERDGLHRRPSVGERQRLGPAPDRPRCGRATDRAIETSPGRPCSGCGRHRRGVERIGVDAGGGQAGRGGIGAAGGPQPARHVVGQATGVVHTTRRRPPPPGRGCARGCRRGTGRRRGGGARRPTRWSGSEQEVALGHGELAGRVLLDESPSTVTVNVSGSTRDRRAARRCSTMSALVRPTAVLDGTTRCAARAARPARPRPQPATRTRSTSRPAVRPNAPNIGRGSTGCGVGIDALASPIAPHAITPPLTTTCGRTPKNRGSYSTRSASLPGSIEPISPLEPVRDRRADRVLGDVALGPLVVGPTVAGQRPAATLHDVRGLPGADDHLTDPAHGLGVRADHRDGARCRAARPRRRSSRAGCGSPRTPGPRARTD